MDALIERIENARAEADFLVANGDGDKPTISLSLEDCSVIGAFLTKAYGPLLVGKRDAELAETMVILAGAFEGEPADDEDS